MSSATLDSSLGWKIVPRRRSKIHRSQRPLPSGRLDCSNTTSPRLLIEGARSSLAVLAADSGSSVLSEKS